MPDREPAILIEDIRSAIEKIDRYTSGIDLETFLANEMIVDAVVRNLEIVGEAVRRLPDEFKQLYPEIPGLKSLVFATGLCTIILVWICN